MCSENRSPDKSSDAINAVNIIFDVEKLAALRSDISMSLIRSIAEETAKVSKKNDRIELLELETKRFVFIRGRHVDDITRHGIYAEDSWTKAYVNMTSQSELGSTIYIEVLFKGNYICGWLAWSGGIFCDLGSVRPASKSVGIKFKNYIEQLAAIPNKYPLPTYESTVRFHVSSWLKSGESDD